MKNERNAILRSRLRIILRIKEVSARALSLHINLSESYVKRILSGDTKSPSLNAMNKIERSIGVPIGFLTAQREDVDKEDYLGRCIEAERLRDVAKSVKDKDERAKILEQAGLEDETYYGFLNAWLIPYSRNNFHHQKLVDRVRSRKLYDAESQPDFEQDYIPQATITAVAKEEDETFIAANHSVAKPIPNAIPVVGFVGAGAAIYPVNDYINPSQDDMITPPFETPRNAVGVIIKGDSNYPEMDDGDILIYVPNGPFILDDCLNRRCIIHTSDDRILVKRLRRGRTQGLFDLHSVNAPLMEDVEVTWAAPIIGSVYR